MSGLRWSQVDDDGALFGVDDLLAPDRSTGRMSDLEFLHVTARKVINAVPSASRAPFRWTINPYRGCSHACSYCMVGDTPILMADGRVKSLAEVRVGDHVYGTTFDGKYHRYVASEVLDHWRTVAHAYRVTLADGTCYVTSGEHRFRTDRGWKYVTDAHPTGQRPHLTPSNIMLGVGALPTASQHDRDYQRGYLTGLIRGDATIGTYHYDRPGRSRSTVHQFRLALVDDEPLDRATAFLTVRGIATTWFQFSPESATRRPLHAIRTHKAASVAAIRELIAWPARPSDQWRRGFLAGIFDAEGSHSGSVLRISNKDPDILMWVTESFAHLGYDAVLEPVMPNGCRTVLLRGGLRERLRFLVTTDPATTRKRRIDGTALKNSTRVRVASIRDLGLELPMFDLTTSTGDYVANGAVSHNCFARPTHEYLGLNIGEDFDRKIVVKVNAVERVRAELASPRWLGEPIAMGTNTDPYQRAEAKYRLTQGIVGALAEHANPFSILTKSPLVARDLDVIADAARRTDVSISFSIGTLDERVWRASEPGTPHPRRRLAAMARFAAAGVRTGALIAPVLPGLSDGEAQLREVVAAIGDAGGRVLGLGPLYLRPGTREHFLEWLAGFDPQLHADYLRRYRDRAYAPEHYLDLLHRRAGLPRRSIRSSFGQPREPADDPRPGGTVSP